MPKLFARHVINTITPLPPPTHKLLLLRCKLITSILLLVKIALWCYIQTLFSEPGSPPLSMVKKSCFSKCHISHLLFDAAFLSRMTSLKFYISNAILFLCLFRCFETLQIKWLKWILREWKILLIPKQGTIYS